MHGPRHVRIAMLAAGSGALLLGACSSSPAPRTASSTTTARSQALTVLVTNDDGVGAPGIDAVVQGLRTLPHTQVTVVAPLTDQSGTGERTTPSAAGALVTSAAQTASGYGATAVHGYPADTVIWAVKDHGLSFRPDLVVSGINFGQNVGPLAAGSGTVGAAREAASLGVPALAASQGVDDGLAPDFSEAVPIVEGWVTEHRSALITRSYGSKPPQASLNVPTCAGGKIRGTVTTVLAASGNAGGTGTVACTSSSRAYGDDMSAFEEGFATLTPLYPPPAS